MLRSWTSKVTVGLIIVGAVAVFWPRSGERPSGPAQPIAGASEPVREEPSAPAAWAVPIATSASGTTVQPASLASAGTPAVPSAAALDDATLMERLRAVQDSDPYLARQLAEEGQRRFPNSPEAAERAALAIKALARQGRISEARGEAERMVDQYPGTKWALEVERHTGAHPHKH